MLIIVYIQYSVFHHFSHTHFCRNYVKPNVLVLGPSGCGKTHLVRTMAQLIGVPFVKCDATKFSATGYVGGDVEDPVRSLVAAAHGDVALAEVYVKGDQREKQEEQMENRKAKES